VSALNLKELRRILALVYSRIYSGGNINECVVLESVSMCPVGGGLGVLFYH